MSATVIKYSSKDHHAQLQPKEQVWGWKLNHRWGHLPSKHLPTCVPGKEGHFSRKVSTIPPWSPWDRERAPSKNVNGYKFPLTFYLCHFVFQISNKCQGLGVGGQFHHYFFNAHTLFLVHLIPKNPTNSSLSTFWYKWNETGNSHKHIQNYAHTWVSLWKPGTLHGPTYVHTFSDHYPTQVIYVTFLI